MNGAEDIGSLVREHRRAAGISLGPPRDLEQDRTSRRRPILARRLAGGLGPQVPRLATPEQEPVEDGTAVTIRVLGPLEAWLGRDLVELGPPKQRAVLGLLALHPDVVVHQNALVDALWRDGPPASARTMLHGYVSRLRRLLDPGRPRRAPGGLLVPAGAGYRLDAGDVRLDLIAFDRLLRDARARNEAGDMAGACEVFERALGLWRGEVLADVDALYGHPAVTAMARRRAETVEEFAAAAIAEGVPERVMPQLRALTEREPLNERGHARLMIALAATGRQAEALEVHRELRERLADQLGVGPGEEVAAAHAQVLRGEAGRTRTTAVSVVPRQLPAATRHFAGRSRELAELTRLLDDAGGGDGDSGTMVISAIGGAAGVGKTALAVHWAHQVAGRFGDGQLYANLRGFDPAGRPASPSEVIRDFLGALGVTPEATPASLDAQAALYRSLLAGRRVLVLLDNAGDSAQVRPLLPGSPGCLVVVTSRAELTGLVAGQDAHPLTLDVLSGAEARALLADCIGSRPAAAYPGAVGDLAELCGRLPLALRVVAARAATRPDLPLAVLAAELRDAGSKLDALSAGEPATDVRATFSWSYRQLGATAARMFRLLGTAPGHDISLAAAASLAGIPVAEASSALGELTRAHLVTERLADRYACHDLLRAYAAELAEAEEPDAERATAIGRLLSWYLHTAHAADEHMFPHRRISLGSPPPHCDPLAFPGYQQAIVWFEAEYANLAAAAEFAVSSASHEVAAVLPMLTFGFACLRRPLAEWIYRARTGIDAAHQAGDARAETMLLNRIGNAHHTLGQYEDAIGSFEAALRIRRETGDREGEGATLNNLGSCYGDWKGQFDRAIDCFQQSLVIAREISGNRYSESVALSNLAEAYRKLGQPELALGYNEQCLAITREDGNLQMQARMLNGLASTYRALSRPDDALGAYGEALDVCRSAGDRYAESEILLGLGDLLSEAGQRAEARAAWQDALDIREELRHPGTESLRARLAGSRSGDGS